MSLARHLSALVVDIPPRLARTHEHPSSVSHPRTTSLEIASPGCAARDMTTNCIDLENQINVKP